MPRLERTAPADCVCIHEMNRNRRYFSATVPSVRGNCAWCHDFTCLLPPQDFRTMCFFIPFYGAPPKKNIYRAKMQKKAKQRSTLHAVDSPILQFFHSSSTMFLETSSHLFRSLVQAILRKYTNENRFAIVLSIRRRTYLGQRRFFLSKMFLDLRNSMAGLDVKEKREILCNRTPVFG